MLPYAYERKRPYQPRPEPRRPNRSSFNIMPRIKRHPLLFILVAIFGLFLLYSATSGNNHDMPFRVSTESRLTQASDRNTETSNFRQTTPEEIAHSIKGQGGHVVHPDVAKEQLVKELTNDKPPAAVSNIAHGDHSVPVVDFEQQSVAGRKMMPKPKAEKPRYPVTSDEKPKFVIGEEPAMNGGKPEKYSNPATLAATAELDDILKRSPIIIFSKSHCPYSARAKRLLLETYHITPQPHVVELDLLTVPLRTASKGSFDNDESGDHDRFTTTTLGRKIQDLLSEWTGRATVPNILVNAVSIGGSDDIAALERDGKLVAEIKRLGVGKVREMVKVEEES